MLLGLADEIIPGLFQGRRPRSAQDLKDYMDATITASVGLSAAAEADFHFLPGRVKVLLPMEDDNQVLEADVRAVAALVCDLLRGGHRVLVACDAGQNRSGLVVARALIYQGMAPEEAIALVRDRRAKGGGVSALTNPAFAKWLMHEGTAVKEPERLS